MDQRDADTADALDDLEQSMASLMPAVREVLWTGRACLLLVVLVVLFA